MPVLVFLALLLTACGGESDKGATRSDAALGGEDAGASELATRSDAALGGDDAGTTEPAIQVGAPYNECKVDSDCGWGEIKHEILKKSDCVCLYGCPYLPLSASTVARRASQHQTLCDPRRDGKGEACGIDDCSAPPAIVCAQGVCSASPDAGAAWR